MKKYSIAMLVCMVSLVLAKEFPSVPGTESTKGTGQIQTDRIEATPSVYHEPVWKQLERMSQQERENSKIELILEQDATNQALKMAQNIENLWNNASFEQSLALFPELEELTDINEMAIGNAWRTPVPTEDQPKWGADVRIGNRDSIFVNAFDIHRASGNLFAALLYREGSSYRWSMNFSSDGGSTWSETYEWAASYELKSLSASVVSNHCYVGFGRGFAQDQAFLYRFKASDGSQEDFNNGSLHITVFTTTAPDSIKEVALCANQDYYDNRLYYLSIISSGALKYFYSDQNAITWGETTTGVADAKCGLDACTNEDFGTYYLLASYLTTADQVKADGNSSGGSWDNLYNCSVGSSPRYTAIGAYHDTLLCAYEYQGAADLWVRYVTSYNGGANWYWGYFDDTTTTQESPDVALRYGGGEGVIYRFYTSPRELRYTWRDYLGSWLGPVATTENEPYYNKPCIEYLGSNVFGVVYLVWTSVRAAYFTRSDWTGIVEENPRDMTSNLVNLAPNPSNGIAKLFFIVKKEGNVRVSLYDASGRLVSSLCNETKSAGTYTLNLNNQNLSNGIYFVHVETPDGVATKTMTIVR